MVRELPSNLPLTAILSADAIDRGFSTQPITGEETIPTFTHKMRNSILEAGSNLSEQEVKFYEGTADAIKADYIKCGFLPDFERDVQSGQVFDPSVTTTKEAIEARVSSFWQKMMYDTPAGIALLKGQIETEYKKILEQGVAAGVMLNGKLVHDNRLVETVITTHHMIDKVIELLKQSGYKTTAIRS